MAPRSLAARARDLAVSIFGRAGERLGAVHGVFRCGGDLRAQLGRRAGVGAVSARDHLRLSRRDGVADHRRPQVRQARESPTGVLAARRKILAARLYLAVRHLRHAAVWLSKRLVSHRGARAPPHVSVRAATGSMVIGIVAAALFYAAVLLSAGSIIPWRSILTAELPSVAAFDALLPGRIAPVILVVAICSLAKTWNAVIMMASRLVLAQARAGLLPAWLGRIDARRKTPRNALLLVTGASMIGIFLGRGAIVPIVNMATICVSMTIALMLAVLIVQRRRQPRSPGFSVPAPRLLIPVCAVGAVLMAGFASFQPLWVQSGVPLEWKLIALWSLLGFIFRLLMRR